MNLWGFESRSELSRMAGGRFGLMQTAAGQNQPVTIRFYDGPNDTSAETWNNGQLSVLRNDTTTPRGNLVDQELTAQQIGDVITALRENGGSNDGVRVGQQIQVTWHQNDDDGQRGPRIQRDITSRRITITQAMLDRVNAGRNSSTTATPAGAQAQAGTPGAPPAPGATTQGNATTTTTADTHQPTQQEIWAHEAEVRREGYAHEQQVEARQAQQAREQQTTQTQAQAQALAAAQPSTFSQIAGATTGLLLGAGQIASNNWMAMNSNVSATSTPFGATYSATGLGAVGGGLGYGGVGVANSFLGGLGGGTALGGASGSPDFIGFGNTMYGQALDERSRARRIDSEINRLKMMISMGNMDAILQAVTLLTLRFKTTLRTAAMAMIQSSQASNQRLEVQNNRLQALSGNSGSGQNNQAEMLSINNNIQGITADRQTAMNSLRDMMSALEEQTSSEQSIRRGFEQLRQISSRS